MSFPPTSPPSSPLADLLAKLVMKRAIASERASDPSDQEAQDCLRSSVPAVVTPPDTSQKSSSSPVTEPEHEQHKHKHNQQTQKIIQRLRQLKDGRIPSQLPWQVFPLSHHEFVALYPSIKADSARLAAYFDDKVRYDYFYGWQLFVLHTFRSSAHERLIRKIDAEILRQLHAKTFPPQAKAVESLGSATIELPDDPHQGYDGGCNIHSPDACYGLPNEQLPGVILEVANTQKAKLLDQIAEDYILGSNGQIRVLLAVKFNYANSKKATLSMWKFHVAQNDEGKWELSCQNTMREVAFSDADGNPIPISQGLELQLSDFALQFRDEPGSVANRIYIPPTQLHSIVHEVRRSQSIQDSLRSRASEEIASDMTR